MKCEPITKPRPGRARRLLGPVVALAGALGMTTAHPAAAAGARVGHVEVELLAEDEAIAPGRTFTVAVRLAPDDHWHTYWRNPGDAGQPTTITWKLPPGFTAGEIQWPAPTRINVGPLVSYGYEGEAWLLTEITPPRDLADGGSVPLAADVSWLVCADECIPGAAALHLELPVRAGPVARGTRSAAGFAEARARLPEEPAGNWPARFAIAGGAVELAVTLPPDVPPDPARTYFFAAAGAVVDPAQPQAARRDGTGRLLLRLARSADAAPDRPDTLAGVLVFPQDGRDRALALTARPAAATETAGARNTAAMAGILVSAFLGGLILNLMPCVFPVLGVKVLGFVHQSGADRRRVSMHGLVFTAGVLVSFWILGGILLALRSGGEQLGWGFQLQSPGFVYGLALFLLVFALNLSGVFEFGLAATRIGGAAQMQSGYAGSFLTGALVTIVSTPCAAPFLAPALGAALTLPAGAALALFTTIGLGLALPYLLLSAFPSLVRMLPRPGAWMETFKQIMAFPLYATVAFLIWVLAGQVDENGLFTALGGLVLVAMAFWAYGRGDRPAAGGAWRRVARAWAALALVGGIAVGWPRGAPAGVDWRPWSPEAVAQARAEGRTVYVDFTARWCATCKVNKLAVFSSSAVQDALVRDGVVLLKADWTNQDPAITRALAAFGRSAVPFNLVYGPGDGEPLQLPEVLTPAVVLEALARARDMARAVH